MDQDGTFLDGEMTQDLGYVSTFAKAVDAGLFKFYFL